MGFSLLFVSVQNSDSISYRNSEQNWVHEGKDIDESCIEKRALTTAGNTYIQVVLYGEDVTLYGMQHIPDILK